MHDQNDNATRPVNFIRFHGLTLLVVENGGIEYIPAKPLCDLAGLQWKGAQRTLNRGDNAMLYGVRGLMPPSIDQIRTPRCPESEVLYIRPDRSRMYMARISTDQMRNNGNVVAAEKLLALQIEWAEALHAYETHGIAVKASRQAVLRDLLGLAKARASMTDPRERKALTTLLHDELVVLGVPLDAFDDPQGALLLRESTV